MRWTRRDMGRLAIGAGVAASATWRPAAAEGVVRAHGVSAFGDLKYGPDFTHFDYATPEAPKGGTFSTGYGGVTFDSLNPFVLKGNPAIGLTLTFDSLMASAADEPDAMYALIAEDIEYPEDRMWAAFTLNPAATFADGSPITAEDVVWSFEALREKGHPSYRLLLSGVESASVDGEGRVRFNFLEDAARRDLPMTVAGLPVLSRAWFETRDFGDSTLEPILASGAYEVGEAEPGKTISYRRRTDYWAAELPVNRGRNHFDEIRIEYFRDRSAAFEAFKTGAFAFNEEFWSKLWATAYNFPAIEAGDVKRAEVPDERPAGSQGYWFNLRREKLQDVRVRKAIAIPFDFEWSNQTLFYGLYQRTDSFFEGGPMQAEGKPGPGELRLLERFADQLPEGVLDEPAYVPPETDGSGRSRRVLRDAARLLDEAGWTVQDGVRRNAAGEPLEIEFLLVGEGFERITNPYLQNLERIGIQGTVRTVDPAQYERRMEAFDFDMTVDRKAMQLTPGVELLQYFHSSSADSPGSQNTAGVADPVVDGLIEIIKRAESREELGNAVRALDRVLRAMHIWVPQWNKAAHHLAYWDIFGSPEEKPPYARGVIDLWWLDQAKYDRLKDRIGG